MRGLLSCLVVVALLVPRGVTAGSVQIEGEGTAQIVAGNVVSARARALKQARREVMLQAIRRVVEALGPDGGSLDEPTIRRLADAGGGLPANLSCGRGGASGSVPFASRSAQTWIWRA